MVQLFHQKCFKSVCNSIILVIFRRNSFESDLGIYGIAIKIKHKLNEISFFFVFPLKCKDLSLWRINCENFHCIIKMEFAISVVDPTS